MSLKPPECIKITYLYVNEDQPNYAKLKDYLAGVQRNGLVQEVPIPPAGSNVLERTKYRLREAQIIILLLSPNFDINELYNSHEIQDYISIRSNQGARVWPIIVRSFNCEDSPYWKYRVWESGEKPMILPTLDDGCARVSQKMRREIYRMLSKEWAQFGDALHHQMYLPEALNAYEQSLYFIPGYSPALLGKVRVLFKPGDPEKAIQAYQELDLCVKNNQQKKKDAIDTINKQEDYALACDKGYALLALEKLQEASVTFREICQQIGSPTNGVQSKAYAKACAGIGEFHLLSGPRSANPGASYRDALNAYGRAREFDPQEPEYLAKLGEVYIASGNCSHAKDCYEKALDAYQRILHYLPDYIPAIVGKGNALYYLDRFNEALEVYEKALAFSPRAIHAHSGRGNTLLALKRPQEALHAFEKALSLEDSDSRYYYGKGRAYALLGQHQEALDAYDKARDHGLKSGDFFVYRAETLLELADVASFKDQQAALDRYNHALEAYKLASEQGIFKWDDIYYVKGKIFFAGKNWENAQFYFQKVIDFAPKKASAYLEMGRTLVELGKYEEAFKCFEAARSYCDLPESRIDSADVETAYGDAYYHRANTSNTKEHDADQERAQAHYTKAIGVREHARAYAGLGRTYEALHCYEKAIESLRQALKINQAFAECYYIYGKCLCAQHRSGEACSLFSKALNLGFDSVSLQLAYGCALLAVSEYPQAIKAFDIVISYRGDDAAHANCCKGLTLYIMERFEEALQAFIEANRLHALICSQSYYQSLFQDLAIAFKTKLHNNLQDALLYKCIGDTLLLLSEEKIEEAKEAYTKAIMYGDRSADVLYSRGKTYEILHEYAHAFKDYCSVLTIDANHTLAQDGKERVEGMMPLPQRSFLQRWLSK